MTLKLRLSLIKEAKRLYHLIQRDLALINPDYALAVEDAFFAMQKGKLSDSQLRLLAAAYKHDQEMRALAREEKERIRGALPQAWKKVLKKH